MATITHRLGPFTGSIGPVRFVKGVAETEDADMVAYFEADPDTYDVETDTPADPPADPPVDPDHLEDEHTED